MDAEDLSTLKRLVVELELKVASLEEKLSSQNRANEDVLARLHRLERELNEKGFEIDHAKRPLLSARMRSFRYEVRRNLSNDL